MSVQKLISEADKLLEKGKFSDAITKLKQAFKLEPLNQILVTKLANLLTENGDSAEAGRVFGELAKNLSEAGKSQLAIAMFKQAIDLIPADFTLRLRYAQECEALGKMGDAVQQGQVVLQFYLRRKKYFDAANIMPMLVRCQPKDEKLKLLWLEVLQFSQAEQKLPHLLVALCGPPGLMSQEFSVGGDSTNLSDSLYDLMKRLVLFFPRDPKLPYAVAWSAHRRGRTKDFYHYLRESLRREPDFCLSILLFARVLSEQQKLNEALFVYRHLKERMASDKSVDLLTLNRLLEAFTEKNGWINFTDGFGGSDSLEPAGFTLAFQGGGATAEEIPHPLLVGQIEESQEIEAPVATELPPAEIELSVPAVDMAGDANLEIMHADGQTRRMTKENAESRLAPPAGLAAFDAQAAQLIRATIEATVKSMALPTAAQATVPQPIFIKSPDPIARAEVEENTGTNAFKGETVEFTSLTKMPEAGEGTGLSVSMAPSAEAPAGPSTPLATTEPVVAPPPVGPEVEKEASKNVEPENKKKLFNPMEVAASSHSEMDTAVGEKTQVFSPMELLDVARVMKNHVLNNVPTKSTIEPLLPEPAPPVPPVPPVLVEKSAEEATKWKILQAEGEATRVFAPVEAVNAAVSSRRPRESMIDPVRPSPPPIPNAVETPLPVPKENPPFPALDPIAALNLEKATEQGSDFIASVLASLPQDDNGVAKDSQNAPIAQESVIAQEQIVAQEPIAAKELAAAQVQSVVRVAPPPPPPPPLVEPLPVQAAAPVVVQAESAVPKTESQSDQPVDLGDDLLEGPTRVFTRPTLAVEKTQHLIKELRSELKGKAKANLNIDILLKRAERYTAKRNYYLARKALRHAQALGADDVQVKARLREIRKLELPDGLYSTISTDRPGREDTSEILDRLEQEFDLSQAKERESAELGAMVEEQIEAIFQESDPRMILDFGVGLHEMGLFRQAEGLFMRMVGSYPDHAFDAYYLAAVSKLARRDYAGAASILKKLSSDSAKTESEKIQIYYALGETFEKMRQRERSRAFFEKVAELDANYRNIRHKLEE